jgi:hypothetical protein
VLRNDMHAGRTQRLDPSRFVAERSYIAFRCRLKAAVPCGPCAKKLWISREQY